MAEKKEVVEEVKEEKVSKTLELDEERFTR